MNTVEQYRQRQNPSLLFNYNAGSTVPLKQSAHGTLSCEGIPQPQSDNHFMPPSSITMDLDSNFYGLSNSMSIPQSSQSWSGSVHLSSPYNNQTKADDISSSSPYITGNKTDDMFTRAVEYAEAPRIYEHFDPRSLTDGKSPIEDYENSVYTANREILEQHCIPVDLDSSYGLTKNYRHPDRLRYSGSSNLESSSSPTVGAQSFDEGASIEIPTEAFEDCASNSCEMRSIETEEHGLHEPYAKLIYKALMSTPDHSMVLQEIYQWFRENTAKGSSDTRGWMNSIRHNLSMNAAFKKTERKSFGDETKRSTEWVLEAFAIKDGVQSTTRYRKGNGSKKCLKSEKPTPARQTPGRKAVVSASKNKMQRQKIKDEHLDLRRPTPQIGIPGSHIHFSNPRCLSQFYQRHGSPLTPPLPEHVNSAGPYLFSKPHSFATPYECLHLKNFQEGSYDINHSFSDSQDEIFQVNQVIPNVSQPY